MLKLLGLAGLLVLGGSLGLANCGSGSASSPGTSNPNPVLSPDGSSPAQLAGDGRYFGYVRSVDAKSEPPTIGFDVAQFFFGKAVQKAAEADGAVRPGEPVANDHYERNPDRRASPLKLAPDVRVTAAPPASILMGYVTRRARAECEAAGQEAPPCTQIPLSFSRFSAAVDELDPAYGIPVWVTIRDDLVVRIEEQYFP